MFVKNYFNNLKIGNKFNLFLLLVFFMGIILSGFALSITLNQRAEAEILSKASILLQTMNALRTYTNEQVNPLLVSKLDTEVAFTPEAVPSYSVREVFEYFRQNDEYQNFFYKDAAPNPTNLRDKSDEFETELLNQFKQQPAVKQKEGFRDFPQGKVFYIARPIEITKQSCLVCHSTPDVAPKSMLTSYGSENGFNWNLHELIGTQIIYVPIQEINNLSKRSFITIFLVIIAIFVVLFLLFNWLLKETIIKRLRRITKTAQDISTGDMSGDFEETSKDEIGLLAKAFNRLKYSLELALQMVNEKNII